MLSYAKPSGKFFNQRPNYRGLPSEFAKGDSLRQAQTSRF